MAEFINMLYQEGESVSHAGWLLSGLKKVFTLSTEGTGHFTAALQQLDQGSYPSSCCTHAVECGQSLGSRGL